MGYYCRSYSHLKDSRKYYEQLYGSKFDKQTNSMKRQFTKTDKRSSRYEQPLNVGFIIKNNFLTKQNFLPSFIGEF